MIVFIIIFLTILRTILNVIIYRHEYDYSEHTDGVATTFSPGEVETRDNAVILIALGFFTLFWIKFTKIENRRRVAFSNVLSLLCAVLLLFVVLF